MRNSATSIFFSFLIHLPAFAQLPDSCKGVIEIPEVKANDPNSYQSCDCAQGLGRKYKVSAPEQFSLVAVCGYKVTSWGETYGAFYFKGDALIEGEIKRNEYVSGTLMLFVAPRKERAEIVDSLDLRDELRVMDFSGEMETFHPPKFTDNVQCWKAMTKIRVTNLVVLLGGGDEQGSFPLKYQVLSLSGYEACQLED